MSLRIRLTAITVLLVGLGLFAAAFATHHYLESFMLDRLDQQMASGNVRSLPGGSYAAAFNNDGQGPPSVSLSRGTTPAEVNRLKTVPDGYSSSNGYRFFATHIPGGRVVIAAPLRDVDATVSELTQDEILIGAIVLLVVGGLAYYLIGVGMRPLVRIEETAGEIAAGDLSRRVEDTDPKTEVGRLGIALNGMLTHIEDAFNERQASENRLRRFVADASHELRTPLTSVRGYAELFRRGAADRPDDLANAMRRIEAESARMGVLVDDLLLLAQLDQGRPVQHERVDLVPLVNELAADARAIEPDRHLEVETDDSVVILGDDARLRQVVGNLLANARAHTPPDAAVNVSVRHRADEAVIEVADHGPGIDPADLERVFERFFRADPSRARASGGTGLGLSIVSSVAEAHGGRAEAASVPGEGSAFRVILPLAKAPLALPPGDVPSPDATLTQP